MQTPTSLLVVGTSAVVYPAAGLITSAPTPGQAVIEVNLEPTPVSGAVDIGLYGQAGDVLAQLVPADAALEENEACAPSPSNAR